MRALRGAPQAAGLRGCCFKQVVSRRAAETQRCLRHAGLHHPEDPGVSAQHVGWCQNLGTDAPGGSAGMNLQQKEQPCQVNWDTLAFLTEWPFQHDAALGMAVAVRAAWGTDLGLRARVVKVSDQV